MSIADWPCRHCGDPSMVLVYLPLGCFVYSDRVQALCWYHYDRLDHEHTVIAPRHHRSGS